jgi:uncharacterized protein YecE (DUF72 family)
VTERLAVGPAVYVRFHGGEGKYWGRYSDKRLMDWAEWLVEQARVQRASGCYFKKENKGQALDHAQTLK